tara:strand:- start:129 stop:653 length:525 start_codon:yes stop_codon:yes gene_type:complete
MRYFFSLRKESVEDKIKHELIFCVDEKLPSKISIFVETTNPELFDYYYKSLLLDYYDTIDRLIVSKEIARDLWSKFKSKGFSKRKRFSRFKYENESLEAQYIDSHWNSLSDEERSIIIKKNEVKDQKYLEELVLAQQYLKEDQETGFEHLEENRGDTWVDDFMEGTNNEKDFND